MVPQLVAKRARHLAESVRHRGRELGVLPGVPVPTRNVGVRERPVFEAAGSPASVTWLGAVPPTPIARASTAGTPRREFDDLHAAGLPARDMLVLSLPGASLATDGGAVITANGELVYDTLWDDPHYERSEFSSGRRLPPATAIAGTCASVISLWHANYHHWLFDALPRLAVLELAGQGSLPVIVPEHLSSFQRDTLDLLGYTADRRRPFTRGHVRPETLVWPSPASQIGFPSRYVVEWLRREIRPWIATPASSGRRLFLSRSLAPTRHIRNEAAVIAALSAYGFETVNAERLTFRQQVELFSAAEAVVAPHGAGTSNIVFGEHIAVLEILQPQYLNLCYYALAGACEHDYSYMFAEPVGRPGKESDLFVSVEHLIESVERMLAGSGP